MNSISRRLAEYLNGLDAASAGQALRKCCATDAWVASMLHVRPFADDGAVFSSAAAIWRQLKRDDWLEAFAAHPRIGDVATLKAKYADTRQWAGCEQVGVAGACDETLDRLATLNADYAMRFGYIFIVCATGKSAEEMLKLLQDRLSNDPESELLIAAGEQLKITQLRLGKLVE